MLVALAFITLDFRESGGPVGGLQRAADTVFDPIQEGFAAVVRPVGNVFGSIFEVGSLRDRVASLERDNEELRADLLVQADLQRRLGEAEQLLNMSAQDELDVVAARVIAAPPGTFERQIVIDAGAAQGIAREMVVINSRGVVGLVVEVTATRARVNLISSTEAGLGVRVAQTGDRGLLTGQGSGLLQLEMLDSDPRVPLDAILVTQSSQGSLVPGGLPVGLLEPPPDGDPQGERFLEVRPYVDFSALSTVAVVRSGREEDGVFSDQEIIDGPPLEPIPRVTTAPDPGAAAVPGVDFPAVDPTGSEDPGVSEGPAPAPTSGGG